MVTTAEFDAARDAWKKTKKAVESDETKIKNRRDTIRDLESKIADRDKEIRELRDDLPQKQLGEQEARAELDQILREIEEEIGLKIKTSSSSTVQGGTAIFTAEYDKAPLAGTQLTWDTGGCAITSGNEHSPVIEIDTSSVQPGDYGISLFLTEI